MDEVLHKYPSTPHLDWLGQENVRDDKVLTPAEARKFLSGPVVVEEKVDGANLGLSFDPVSQLRFQNRGNWLSGKLTGQWERLHGWAADHEAGLRDNLPSGHILFGEWCYIKHSIRYECLPDWFLVFDVYDCREQKFWSVRRRDALAAAAHLATVPRLSIGLFSPADLRTILDGRSDLYGGPREGIYLRREDDDWLLRRAKLVQLGFTQTITVHWTRQGLVANRLCASAIPPS
jgi:hypothetical protein